jgi:nucleoside-diphosphate-sugar epimerase
MPPPPPVDAGLAIIRKFPSMAKLVLGCGYLGLRVARLWLDAGEKVFAVTRHPNRATELAASGIDPIVGDLLGDSQIPLPQGVRTVLFAVGFDRQRGGPISTAHTRALTNAIRWMPFSLDRFLFISSTGVYGQTSADLVDEDSSCDPSRESGKASLAAEQVLQSSRFAQQATVLRLAGLYGPGRIPRADSIKAGQPIDAPQKGWLNLIYVDDAARIVLLAEERGIPPRTYVVSDGAPVLRGDYYAELARLLGAPAPRFTESTPDAPAAQRASSDKRINPRRMFEELRPSLLYPDYHAGLAAIVAESTAN